MLEMSNDGKKLLKQSLVERDTLMNKVDVKKGIESIKQMIDKKFHFKITISEKGEVFMSFCDPRKQTHNIECQKVPGKIHGTQIESEIQLTVLKHPLLHMKLF